MHTKLTSSQFMVNNVKRGLLFTKFTSQPKTWGVILWKNRLIVALWRIVCAFIVYFAFLWASRHSRNVQSFRDVLFSLYIEIGFLGWWMSVLLATHKHKTTALSYRDSTVNPVIVWDWGMSQNRDKLRWVDWTNTGLSYEKIMDVLWVFYFICIYKL